MRSPTVKVVTANVGNLKRDDNIARHPNTVEQIIKVAGYPELVLLQETNWTSGSLEVAQNHFSCMTLKKGKRYSLIGSSTARSAGESLGVGLVYSSDVSIIRSNTTFPSLYPVLENRLLRADVLINGTDVLLTVLVVYAPVETHGKNSKSDSFYRDLGKYLEEVPCEHPIVACGDWNAVATVSDGAAKRTFSKSLRSFLSSWDLEDAFQIIQDRGTKINYTDTNKGRTSRRLDQLHMSSELRGFVRSTKALVDNDGSNLTKSTHKAIQFSFRFGPLAVQQLRGLGVWRMPYWIQTEEYREWLLVRVAMILANLEGLPHQIILVQLKSALKTVISEEARDRAIRLSRMPAKERKEAALKATASGLKFPSFESPEQTKSRVKKAKREMEILALTKPDGSVVRGTEDIMDISADYFEGMFSRVPETNEEMEGDFLDLFPSEDRLSSPQQEVLDLEFSKEEVLAVIKRVAKKNSAPGPDGIPFKFYLICWDLLGDLLTAVYNAPASGEPILEERNTSVIKLIYKSGNPADISNYRPIALMNTEVKIYTHLINERLKPLLDDLIHPSQSGFVPGRLMSDNLDVVDHFMNQYSDNDKGWMVGSLDFRKAYDTVSQDWVLKCLANVGVPAKMLQRVAAVQQSAISKVYVRGFLTRPIRILVGVRQGCPLSPLLFIFSVDCLVRRMDQSMRGLVSHIPVPPYEQCLNDKHRPPGPGEKAEGPTALLEDAKVLAYADDIIVFMSCNNDLQVVGEALVDFQRVSGLALSPSKTVLQRIGGTKIQLPSAGEFFAPGMLSDYHGPPPPDLYDTSHVDMAFVRKFWPKDPVTGETPQLLPRDKIFRYLGIFFGGAKALEAHYTQVKQDLRDELKGMSLWGLPTYSKACLINMFFFSKVVFLAPYVEKIDGEFLHELGKLACDCINKTKHKHANARLIASIDQGGFNLRDLPRFGRSLRAVRAFRFFNRGSPALKDAAFQFYSDYSQEWSCERLGKDVFTLNRQWSRYLSPTMEICLTSLNDLNGPVSKEVTDPSIPPEPTESSSPFYIWEHSQALERAEIAKIMKKRRGRIQAQRHLEPVRHLTLEELEHLEWGTGPRSQEELMAQWRIPQLLKLDGKLRRYARPYSWEVKGVFPPSLDSLWSNVMGKMRTHYLKDAYKAETLHYLRTGLLSLYHSPVPDHYDTIWKKPGCGICRDVSTVDLFKHVFCECPVMKAMLLKLGIPPVATLGEWTYGEEPLCRRKSKSKDKDKLERDNQERKIRGNYYRELASGIWRLERKLRQTGEDANQVEIQDKFSFLLEKAQSCYLEVEKYEALESSQSQETEAVALWLEESGQEEEVQQEQSES